MVGLWILPHSKINAGCEKQKNHQQSTVTPRGASTHYHVIAPHWELRPPAEKENKIANKNKNNPKTESPPESPKSNL